MALIIRLFHTPNLPISPASPIAFSKKSRYICRRKLKVTHSSFIKLAERGLDGLTPLIRWPSGSARLSKSTGQRICFRCFCCNILISLHLIIVFSKKSRYICSGESQRLTHPKGFSFVKSAEKGFECGLTPLSDGHRVSRAFITQQAVERSSAAFVVTVIYSPIVSSKRLCYICTVIRL